jgi:hypothetical protein
LRWRLIDELTLLSSIEIRARGQSTSTKMESPEERQAQISLAALFATDRNFLSEKRSLPCAGNVPPTLRSTGNVPESEARLNQNQDIMI